MRAVDGVSFDLSPGETLGLVGETGCGKSTLARCVAGCIRSPGPGPLRRQRHHEPAQSQDAGLRRDIQMIFQDPYGSLNPRRRVGSIIADPFVVHRSAAAPS